MDKIIEAAKKLGCDLVHPDNGFLSDNPNFAWNSEKGELIFIGPPQKAMLISCEKVNARRITSSVVHANE